MYFFVGLRDIMSQLSSYICRLQAMDLKKIYIQIQYAERVTTVSIWDFRKSALAFNKFNYMHNKLGFNELENGFSAELD